MAYWMWLLAGASLVGVILNIKKKKVCFLIWMFTNATWAIIDFRTGLIAQSFLFCIYTILAIWGFWEWRRKRK